MERLVGRPIMKRKLTSYILSTCISKKISLKKFIRKGKKIRLKEHEVLKLPQLKRDDHTYGSINAADLLGPGSKQLIVAAKQELFIYDFRADDKLLHIKKHFFGNICNVKCWRDYIITFAADGPVRIMHKQLHNQKAYVLNHDFAGDYFGGYHAFSRNAELEGNYLIYISKNSNLIVFDLSIIFSLNPEPISETLDFSSSHIKETEGGKFFTKLKAIQVESSNIDSVSLFGRYAYFASMNGNVYRLSKRLDLYSKNETMKSKHLATFKDPGLELTALEFYHDNIIAVLFSLSAKKACIKLLNLKTNTQSEVAISKQDRPTQKILMFVKRKMCFGIALNRGVDMHVFGIHRCNIVLFSENIQLGASHICGILFLDGKLTSSELLVYGQDNYNQVFKVSL
jgi:hypothetical protein